jgi:hypothetical protein
VGDGEWYGLATVAIDTGPHIKATTNLVALLMCHMVTVCVHQWLLWLFKIPSWVSAALFIHKVCSAIKDHIHVYVQATYSTGDEDDNREVWDLWLAFNGVGTDHGSGGLSGRHSGPYTTAKQSHM